MFNLPQIVSELGSAEVRAAHGAVLAIGMPCLLEILQSSFRVEREVELVAPAEFEACLRQSIVAYGSTGMSLCQIGCMGSYLIGNDTCAHIVLIRQGQMLLGGYVAEHGSSQPGYLRTTDGKIGRAHV